MTLPSSEPRQIGQIATRAAANAHSKRALSLHHGLPSLLLVGCLLLITAALQGCASTSAGPAPGVPASTPTHPPAAPAAPTVSRPSPAVAAKSAPVPQGTPPAVRPPSPLEAERDWLQSWFKDTPVRISILPNGALEIEVPLEFCFESGRSRLQPALVAVLDKVAQSLRREDDARLALVAAATDEGGAPGLALLRATQVRSHLVSRGVGNSQLPSPSAQTTKSVLLRVVAPAP